MPKAKRLQYLIITSQQCVISKMLKRRLNNMSIAGYLGIVFFYIAIALIFYGLSEADSQEQNEFRKNCAYWRTTYNTGYKGDDK